MKWYEFKTNTEVLEKANTEDIATTVKRRRWKYLVHVLRMETTRIPKQAWEWKPHGTRKQGRPRNMLKRTIENDKKVGNITDVNLIEEAGLF